MSFSIQIFEIESFRMWFRKEKVKCVNCGFLEPTYDPGEATPKIRQSIQNKEKINGMDINKYLDCNYLVCHRRALSGDIRELDTIIAERDCRYFYPYKQGYSPAQHLQTQDNEKQDKVNWHRDIITATIFTILGVALTLLVTWLTSHVGK
jgi:phage FluMu protein Com